MAASSPNSHPRRSPQSHQGDNAPVKRKIATGNWRLQRQKLLSAENFFGSAGTLPSRKTIRHSLLTIRHSPFTTRHSPFATRYSLFAAVSLAAHFYSFPASPFPAFCFAAMMSARA
jgi:uncharacterized membrane protein YsdA (DUF1294 family)